MYVYLLVLGGDPSEGMPENMFQAFHVIAQKLIVLSFMLATLHQTIAIKKLLKSK